MKKKEYMKPAVRTVQLRNRHQILAGSYVGIQSKNSFDSEDTDFPIYDSSSSSNLWDAN